ncbi:hypothetical protein [Celeribacter sp.]|uniref:hypothetical protein n=1 Tax=Celeribacter sp. TaxID=1890673 RepID=UPI003A90B7FD
MTKQIPHSEDTNTKKPTIARKGPTKTATQDAAPKPRRSIFDDSYAPVGAELRKAWSRHSTKS